MSAVTNPPRTALLEWRTFAEEAPPEGGDNWLLVSRRFHAVEFGWFYKGAWSTYGLHGVRTAEPQPEDMWARVQDPQVYKTP